MEHNPSYHQPKILVYDAELLPYSQTFVREQAEALTSFTPIYLGLHAVHRGLQLPRSRTLLVNNGGVTGRLRELVFILAGRAPNCDIEGQRPKLIHAHFGNGATDVLPLARRLGIPLLATFHGFDATMSDAALSRSTGGRLFLMRRQRLINEAALFLPVSKFIRQRLLAQGYPEARTVLHYIGVDTQKFRPSPAEVRQPIVLFVGRLAEKKGCEYLIRAMSRVQIRRPEIELVVAGDGALRAPLEALARRSLSKYRFVGIQSPEKVRAWMQRSAVLAVPSVRAQDGDSEALGIVTLEAQASGLPVVAFDHGGVPEAVVDGRTGYIVPEADWVALAERLALLISQPDLRLKLGDQARAHVMAEFDLRGQTQKLEQLFEEVTAADRMQKSAP